MQDVAEIPSRFDTYKAGLRAEDERKRLAEAESKRIRDAAMEARRKQSFFNYMFGSPETAAEGRAEYKAVTEQDTARQAAAPRALGQRITPEVAAAKNAAAAAMADPERERLAASNRTRLNKAEVAARAPATVAPTTKSVDRGLRALAAAPAAEAAAASGLSALDAQLAAANKAREDAAKEGVERVKKGQEEDGEYGTEREKRLKAQEAGLKGAEDKNLNMAFIQAGLALMQGTTDRGTIANLAAAAGLGVNAYAKGLDKIEAKREKLDDAVARLEELRRTDRQVSRKELNSAQERVDNAAAASADAMFKWGSDKYNMSRDDARFAVTTDLQRKQINAQAASANRTPAEIQLIERVAAEKKIPFSEAMALVAGTKRAPIDTEKLRGEWLDMGKRAQINADYPNVKTFEDYVTVMGGAGGGGASGDYKFLGVR
jgi:hypothetical protein